MAHWVFLRNKSLQSNQRVVRLFFDILHGINRTDIPLVVALEFAILLGYDGQLKQDSEMEKELFQRSIAHLKETKMTKMENAMIWLYVKTWGLHGQHVIDEDELWNFGGNDLESALTRIVYPRKQNKMDYKSEDNSLIEKLQQLIMEKFRDDTQAFYAWSKIIHEYPGYFYVWLIMNQVMIHNSRFSRFKVYISESWSDTRFREREKNRRSNSNCKEYLSIEDRL